jgi:hypothetical protein
LRQYQNAQPSRTQKYLQKFDFESLFIEELGWDMIDRILPQHSKTNWGFTDQELGRPHQKVL